MHYPVGNHTLSQSLNTFCDLNTSDNKIKHQQTNNNDNPREKTIAIKCLDGGKKTSVAHIRNVSVGFLWCKTQIIQNKNKNIFAPMQSYQPQVC